MRPHPQQVLYAFQAWAYSSQLFVSHKFMTTSAIRHRQSGTLKRTRKVAFGSKLSVPADYASFLARLTARVQDSHIGAARAVNREMILLYWDIGHAIVEKQQQAGWGDAVVERLAADLRAEFPHIRGFSNQNVWRMKQLYLAHSTPEFLSHVVREIRPRPKWGAKREFLSRYVREMVATVPWGHHANVLAKISDPGARLFYLQATARLGWSRDVLLNQIKAKTYERARKEKKNHNFIHALPEHFAEQAEEMLKSRYNLEFLGLTRAIKERELEDQLVSRLQRFILELGYGFCFIGRQHRLVLGTKEYFVDLLFYHRFLKALVAFDLKIGEFEPEYAGKMDFYLNLLNNKERGPGDQPSIGIILCAEKDDIEVEFALKTKNNPIGVAEYTLQAKLPTAFKGKLPTARQLADAARAALPRQSPELIDSKVSGGYRVEHFKAGSNSPEKYRVHRR